ncbi:MAG: hypothetical protein LBK99_25375, partial [Opitutaceae bacterium]|nr:hypothetical protein [Opitutaceae bacterium]
MVAGLDERFHEQLVEAGVTQNGVSRTGSRNLRNFYTKLAKGTERRSRNRSEGKPGILVGMGDMKNQTLPIEPGVPESFVSKFGGQITG